jgi:hypothetical protein
MNCRVMKAEKQESCTLKIMTIVAGIFVPIVIVWWLQLAIRAIPAYTGMSWQSE